MSAHRKAICLKTGFLIWSVKRRIYKIETFFRLFFLRFWIPFNLPSFTLYRSLRRLNPSPFLFHLTWRISLLLAQVRKFWCACAMMSHYTANCWNTSTWPEWRRRREKCGWAAVWYRKTWASDVLDLGRNDVGRVAVKTVRVISNFEIELYSHVMHIASG